MKILYVKTQVGVGGLEKIVSDKMNYLIRKKDYEIGYAYFGNGLEKSPYEVDSRIQTYPINVKSCGSLTVKVKSVWKTYRELQRIIQEFSPDVIVNADCVVITWMLPFIKKRFQRYWKIISLMMDML